MNELIPLIILIPFLTPNIIWFILIGIELVEDISDDFK
jgi:hypothetical protein